METRINMYQLYKIPIFLTFYLLQLRNINYTTHKFVYRFTSDIEEMTGYRPGIYWQITWRFLSPLIMTIILISSVVFMVRNNPTYQAWSADKVRIQFFACL